MKVNRKMLSNDQRSYANIGRDRIDAMINDLQAVGVRISGNNPWSIDTLQHGVQIKAEWREDTSILFMAITKRNWYVSHDEVWNMIDPLMKSSRGPECP